MRADLAGGLYHGAVISATNQNESASLRDAINAGIVPGRASSPPARPSGPPAVMPTPPTACARDLIKDPGPLDGHHQHPEDAVKAGASTTRWATTLIKIMPSGG